MAGPPSNIKPEQHQHHEAGCTLFRKLRQRARNDSNRAVKRSGFSMGAICPASSIHSNVTFGMLSARRCAGTRQTLSKRPA